MRKHTEALWLAGKSKRLPPTILKTALRELFMIDSVYEVEDLRIPSNNRLESLKGDRKDQWSIRINNQGRISFTWQGYDAYELEIVDYH
jgi:proteic killer suppression protein